jgi:hypothetical protein
MAIKPTVEGLKQPPHTQGSTPHKPSALPAHSSRAGRWPYSGYMASRRMGAAAMKRASRPEPMAFQGAGTCFMPPVSSKVLTIKALRHCDTAGRFSPRKHIKISSATPRLQKRGPFTRGVLSGCTFCEWPCLLGVHAI